MKTVVLYWSKTGNTQKVARAIGEVLDQASFDVRLVRVQAAGETDWFDYDLVCLGFTVEECYVEGEFHGSEDKSTRGPLGDTRGRPDETDLALVDQQVRGLIALLG